MDAQAILFESGLYAVLPNDIPEKLALAVLDVAGAPAQVARLVKEGDTVCIIGGGGKSGVLCCYQAMKNVGPYGKVIVVEYSEENARRIKDMNLADEEASKMGLALPVLKQVLAEYRTLEAKGMGDLGTQALFTYYADKEK